MPPKKSAKKKQRSVPRADNLSSDDVVFGFLGDLLSRGVEQGAYRWSLQKNADPKRTALISSIPSIIPDGAICCALARTLNRGNVKIVDSVKSAGSVYQTVLVQTEGVLDGGRLPTLLPCNISPLGCWIMIFPVEDSDAEPPAAVKDLPTPEDLMPSTAEPSKQDKKLVHGMEHLQVKEPPLAAKEPPLPTSGTLVTNELFPSPKLPVGGKQLPQPAKVLPPVKSQPVVKELPPESKVLPSKMEAKRPPSQPDMLPPSQRKVVLPAKDSLPSAKDSLPSAKDSLPSAKDSLPSAKDSFPSAKDSLPSAKDSFPSAKNSLPSAKDSFPSAKLSSSPKEVTITNKIEKIPQTEMAELGNLQDHFDAAFSIPRSSVDFGIHNSIPFPVTKLPDPTYDAVWGGVHMERRERREKIEKDLKFINSTLPFNETQDEYKCFFQELVENLYKEGNDLYRDGDVISALEQYTEGLTVVDYAKSEELVLSLELQCRLFVNRSCCSYSMGLFEKSLEDSEKALSLDNTNMRALYRKSKALDKLGKCQEAYNCIKPQIQALVQDESATEFATELVQKLGLKQRKAYKRPQQELEKFGLLNNGISVSSDSKASSGIETVDDIYTDLPSDSKTMPSSLGVIYPNNNSLGAAACLPSVAPTIVPSANPVNDFTDMDIIGDELDSFLESEMATKHIPQQITVLPPGNHLLPTLRPATLPASSFLPPASFGMLDARNPLVVPAVAPLKPSFDLSLDTLDIFDSTRETLDSLDTFVNDSKPLEPASIKRNAKPKNGGNPVNLGFMPKIDPVQSHPVVPTPAMPLNSLMLSYEFKQGCPQCYVKIGIKALDFTHRENFEHKCKKDILLVRKKNSEKKAWLKVRPRPSKGFFGPYILCKDIQTRQDCKYADNCTFAYYQEEIDVWEEERKGTFHRDQLFQSLGLIKPGSVARLLHEQNGIFTFLCQACFDSKPRIISKRNPENPQFCTNPTTLHRFNDHKCLVHVLNSSTVKYSKIRPLHIRFQMDVCRHEVRYGCLQEDTCNFAHSHVELCVWMLQKQTGVTQEDIVLESERMWKVPETKAKPSPKPLDLTLKFVCAQCFQNGRQIEADRDGKYCAAKARHSWTKEKRMLILMSKLKKKWIHIRPLPSIRSFPQHYEICVHVQNGKKCQYYGNCSFAHSTEEKDIWTYMKENKVLDLQDLLDLCKKNNNSAEKSGKSAAGAQKDTEKQIMMPTDYADLMAGFHCYLCGKNSNSEKQWQKHIQSEKHKERMFTLESEESTWKYRFPAGEFKLCERFEETQSCPNENDCPFAHGRDELEEWHERREVLQLKVSKARKDKLLEPSDSDFGKYTFLMQDLPQDGEGNEDRGTQ